MKNKKSYNQLETTLLTITEGFDWSIATPILDLPELNIWSVGDVLHLKVIAKSKWTRIDSKNGKYIDKVGNIIHLECGKLNQKNTPSIETKDGTKLWYINNQLHREDGPAIEQANGIKQWWIDGNSLTEEEFNHWLSKKELNENLHKKLKEKDSIKKLKI